MLAPFWVCILHPSTRIRRRKHYRLKSLKALEYQCRKLYHRKVVTFHPEVQSDYFPTIPGHKVEIERNTAGNSTLYLGATMALFSDNCLVLVYICNVSSAVALYRQRLGHGVLFGSPSEHAQSSASTKFLIAVKNAPKSTDFNFVFQKCSLGKVRERGREKRVRWYVQRQVRASGASE